MKLFTLKGWPKCIADENMKPYWYRHQELTVENDCPLWGLRVIVPGSIRQQLLKELHESHLGMVKSKVVARSHLWWPKLDEDIKNMIGQCRECASLEMAGTSLGESSCGFL